MNKYFVWLMVNSGLQYLTVTTAENKNDAESKFLDKGYVSECGNCIKAIKSFDIDELGTMLFADAVRESEFDREDRVFTYIECRREVIKFMEKMKEAELHEEFNKNLKYYKEDN